jgi:hypothetical protein
LDERTSYVIDIVRAKFVNHIPFLEASSFLAGQGILCIIWNQKSDYSVQKGLPFVAALIPDRDKD